MVRTFEPTSGTVKVTPTHSPPASVVKDTQPFIDTAKSAAVSSECTGKGCSAVKHQSTSQLQTGSDRQGFFSTEHTGKNFSAAKHQSTSQLQTGTDRPRSCSSERTGKEFSIKKHQSTSQRQTNRPHTDRPKSSHLTSTDSPALHRSRKDSISNLSSGVNSDISDRPPLDLCVEEENSQTVKMLPLLNQTSPSLRNRPTGRQCE